LKVIFYVISSLPSEGWAEAFINEVFS